MCGISKISTTTKNMEIENLRIYKSRIKLETLSTTTTNDIYVSEYKTNN